MRSASASVRGNEAAAGSSTSTKKEPASSRGAKLCGATVIGAVLTPGFYVLVQTIRDKVKGVTRDVVQAPPADK